MGQLDYPGDRTIPLKGVGVPVSVWYVVGTALHSYVIQIRCVLGPFYLWLYVMLVSYRDSVIDTVTWGTCINYTGWNGLKPRTAGQRISVYHMGW